MSFVAIFTSPLVRARETASIIAEGSITHKALMVVARLHESFASGFFHFLIVSVSRTRGDVLQVAHGGVGLAIEAYFRGIPEDGNLLRYTTRHGEVKKYEGSGA